MRNDTPEVSDRTRTDASGDAEPDPAAMLTLEGVTKRYGADPAVDAVDLTVRDGELLTLLGPSGCGKTTTLRMIAGLEMPTSGRVGVDGDVVAADGDGAPPEQRDVGMVFQEFALFPHRTVAENVGFGLDDWDDDRRERRVTELLELVGLENFADRSPENLSGGQRQRVALARSLAPEPEVLLLDEPFANLDIRLRERMREEVRRIIKETNVTAVSVTHDQEEALSISDRVAVMSEGQIEQIGRPETVFEHPKSRFVADFLGQASFLTGRFGGDHIDTGLGTLPADLLQGLTTDYDGAKLDVLIRPDDLRATPCDSGRRGGNGTLVGRQYTGPSFVYAVKLDTGDVVHCEHNHASDLELGERVTVDLVADHTLAWYPAE
jgi:iron(III) transport system ATP-binding protein